MVQRRNANTFSRADRVSEQIRRELAQIIRFEVKDPTVERLLSMVTLNAVEVSPDYAHATVFYTALLQDDDRPALSHALSRLAGFLRKQLSQRIRLHQIPALHFKYDESVERGAHLTRLIDETIAADQRAQTNDSSSES